ncbi:MAG: glycosyltransferase [Roseibium sp.]|uniref:glycosyltransferase family 2 protein n=1 Tax=Roseibium sp. TaxID=1936156 RepID=UPI003D9C20C4
MQTSPKTSADETAAPFLVPMLSRAQKLRYLAGVGLWIAAIVFFWSWWLDPVHNAGTVRYVAVSVILGWITLLPLYFLAMFIPAKVPNPKHGLPKGARVAMVVTKAPSEPFCVVRTTLKAMLAQTLTHDTWLADERPSAETISWCAQNGVRISTRKDRPDYHRQSWPRRTRCKEGNLAFFYDQYGYENYDFVSQLDADHVPEPDYLEKVMAPFADPEVGYVSAPSICDSNAARSWSARGRLYAEGTLHGALQAGYSNGWAPLCIGSHYAVRTAALKDVGGLGPDLAEDHSTTLLMNAGGWRGVHAIDAIAHGDGPNTFTDLVTQEFQWSRSLVTILLQYMPHYAGKLPPRLKFQFLFAQIWYPLFAVFMTTMFALPVVALVAGVPFANVTYPQFLLHFLPISAVLVVMALWWKRDGWCRPYNAKVLSWEALLFQAARWPWAMLGCLAAFRDWLTGSFVDFRVTPKGTDAAEQLPVRVLLPYAVLALVSVVPVLAFADVGEARGFYLFATLNAVIYVSLLAVIVFQHARENRSPAAAFNWRPYAQGACVAVLAILPATALGLRGPVGLEALEIGAEPVKLTRSTYSVAGAGMGSAGLRTVRIRPHLVTPSHPSFNQQAEAAAETARPT